LDRDSSMASISPGPREGGPTVAVNLNDGPLQGKSIETAVVVGRPPMTIDVATGDGGRYATAWPTHVCVRHTASLANWKSSICDGLRS
jgi:hypothetical protein